MAAEIGASEALSVADLLPTLRRRRTSQVRPFFILFRNLLCWNRDCFHHSVGKQRLCTLGGSSFDFAIGIVYTKMMNEISIVKVMHLSSNINGETKCNSPEMETIYTLAVGGSYTPIPLNQLFFFLLKYSSKVLSYLLNSQPHHVAGMGDCKDYNKELRRILAEKFREIKVSWSSNQNVINLGSTIICDNTQATAASAVYFSGRTRPNTFHLVTRGAPIIVGTNWAKS
ncbi:hypothetical protein Scep_021638 [Stephania cephalantha]|uniref:Uncharacterized protein n=1 Tax=Stephania cephalantha TaxID=152367 RepID=A0AAP0F4P8_9MAGN